MRRGRYLRDLTLVSETPEDPHAESAGRFAQLFLHRLSLVFVGYPHSVMATAPSPHPLGHEGSVASSDAGPDPVCFEGL